MTGKYATSDQGVPIYVVSTHGWGETTEQLETAANLTEAKRKYGWTRQLHHSVTVRRATPDDVRRLLLDR